MANTQTTEFYHSDDFYTIGDAHLQEWIKQIELKRQLYAEICECAADYLNQSGLHEKFEVDINFLNNYAGYALAGHGGVFLRSKSGYAVDCSFPIISPSTPSTPGTFGVEVTLLK